MNMRILGEIIMPLMRESVNQRVITMIYLPNNKKAI